ncbi:MAG: helix-turn-helix domain-containing protein [Janthinobacterium lividum]
MGLDQRFLKELRLQRGWSVTDMIVQHGYWDSHWRKYETGQAGGLTVDSLLRLAAISSSHWLNSTGLGEFPRLSITDIERKA